VRPKEPKLNSFLEGGSCPPNFPESDRGRAFFAEFTPRPVETARRRGVYVRKNEKGRGKREEGLVKWAVNKESKPVEQEAEAKDRIRRIVRIGWLVVLSVAVLNSAWVFYSRWQQARIMEQRAIEQQREQDRRAVEMMGGDRFEILQFYASPGVIRRGETAQLCYGVSNAKTVRLEPESGAVWPSFSRCIDVRPAQDTTYTLTIEDGKGHTKAATLVLKIR
jgi:hypothetical protein